MSDVESPGKAIRNWLQGTDSRPTAKPAKARLPQQQNFEPSSRHRSRRHQQSRRPSKLEGLHDEEVGRKHQRYRKSGSRQNKITHKALFPNPLQAQSQKRSTAVAAITPDGHGLAERLGLHAPFRTLEDRSDDSVPEIQSRPRKRKRSRSSTSSYLEPAVANSLPENDHVRLSHPTRLHEMTSRPALGDGGNISPPTVSRDSDMLLPPPGKLRKSYEKRPRHKTCVDRYELKESSRHGKTKQDAKKDCEKKKRENPKRREKSGAALMHGFAAPNVVHDRLTVSCV